MDPLKLSKISQLTLESCTRSHLWGGMGGMGGMGGSWTWSAISRLDFASGGVQNL